MKEIYSVAKKIIIEEQQNFSSEREKKIETIHCFQHKNRTLPWRDILEQSFILKFNTTQPLCHMRE